MRQDRRRRRTNIEHGFDFAALQAVDALGRAKENRAGAHTQHPQDQTRCQGRVAGGGANTDTPAVQVIDRVNVAVGPHDQVEFAVKNLGHIGKTAERRVIGAGELKVDHLVGVHKAQVDTAEVQKVVDCLTRAFAQHGAHFSARPAVQRLSQFFTERCERRPVFTSHDADGGKVLLLCGCGRGDPGGNRQGGKRPREMTIHFHFLS